MASDTEEEYALRRRLQQEDFDKRLAQRKRGKTMTKENPPTQDSFISDDLQVRGNNNTPEIIQPERAEQVGPFAGVSDEELRDAFDRGENSWQTSVRGVPYPLGDISQEINKRYRADLAAEAKNPSKPAVTQPKSDLPVRNDKK